MSCPQRQIKEVLDNHQLCQMLVIHQLRKGLRFTFGCAVWRSIGDPDMNSFSGTAEVKTFLEWVQKRDWELLGPVDTCQHLSSEFFYFQKFWSNKENIGERTHKWFFNKYKRYRKLKFQIRCKYFLSHSQSGNPMRES